MGSELDGYFGSPRDIWRARWGWIGVQLHGHSPHMHAKHELNSVDLDVRCLQHIFAQAIMVVKQVDPKP